ncbi:hypothetical protein FOCC_FOCC000664 [Frankliniella occidentalis]|nr:hypothetical protein FOCC_FOCC000664 [Frankliniella occidentalis]
MIRIINYYYWRFAPNNNYIWRLFRNMHQPGCTRRLEPNRICRGVLVLRGRASRQPTIRPNAVSKAQYQRKHTGPQFPDWEYREYPMEYPQSVAVYIDTLYFTLDTDTCNSCGTARLVYSRGSAGNSRVHRIKNRTLRVVSPTVTGSIRTTNSRTGGGGGGSTITCSY